MKASLAACFTLMGCEALIGADFSERGLDPSGGSAPTAGGMGGVAGSTTTTAGGMGGVAGMGGTGGAQPTDCWSDAGPWIVSTIDATDLQGATPTDMTFSPDGLSLYYIAESAGSWRPHVVTRTDVEESFVGGAQMAAWPSVGAASPGNLWVFGTEMVLRTDDVFEPETIWELSLASLVSTSWGDPVQMNGVSSDDNETWPRAVVDGTRLYFVRADGPQVEVQTGQFLAAGWFYEAQRPAGSPPGTAFTNPQRIPLPPIADTDFVVCFTPSWDGLRLFLGTTYGVALSDETFDTAVRVFYSERGSLSEAWSAPVIVDELNDPTGWSCPLGITEDGCQIVLQRTIGGQNSNHIGSREIGGG